MYSALSSSLSVFCSTTALSCMHVCLFILICIEYRRYVLHTDIIPDLNDLLLSAVVFMSVIDVWNRFSWMGIRAKQYNICYAVICIAIGRVEGAAGM